MYREYSFINDCRKSISNYDIEDNNKNYTNKLNKFQSFANKIGTKERNYNYFDNSQENTQNMADLILVSKFGNRGGVQDSKPKENPSLLVTFNGSMIMKNANEEK